MNNTEAISILSSKRISSAIKSFNKPLAEITLDEFIRAKAVGSSTAHKMFKLKSKVNLHKSFNISRDEFVDKLRELYNERVQGYMAKKNKKAQGASTKSAKDRLTLLIVYSDQFTRDEKIQLLTEVL